MDAIAQIGRGRYGVPTAAVAGLAAALLAGCGGSTPSSSGGDEEGPEQIATGSGEYGTHLTADDGKSVYLWLGDHGSTSACSGACAKAWPPVLTDGAPKAAGSAEASQLGTVKRADGGSQVTYAGHPLYYFAGDSGPGDTAGEGSNGFGAKWWLVAPDGTAISEDAGSSMSPSMSPPTSPSTSPSDSSGGGGY
jgi:predicted lipoprotein with Yx(FWY)xxD motif